MSQVGAQSRNRVEIAAQSVLTLVNSLTPIHSLNKHYVEKHMSVNKAHITQLKHNNALTQVGVEKIYSLNYLM